MYNNDLFKLKFNCIRLLGEQTYIELWWSDINVFVEHIKYVISNSRFHSDGVLIESLYVEVELNDWSWFDLFGETQYEVIQMSELNSFLTLEKNPCKLINI